jgi:TolB-like protein
MNATDSSTQTADPRPQTPRAVALFAIRDDSGRPEGRWLASALTDLLGRELALGERFHLVPGKDVTRALQELGVSEAQPLGVEGLAQLGERLGADLVVSGSCRLQQDWEGTGIRLEARVHDARTGALLGSVQAVGPNDAAYVAEAVAEALRKRLGAAPLTAREMARSRRRSTAPRTRAPRAKPARRAAQAAPAKKSS